jgi:hypothetical protein
MNFGGVCVKPKLKAAPKRTLGDNNDSAGALPQVVSTSTICAPIRANEQVNMTADELKTWLDNP